MRSSETEDQSWVWTQSQPTATFDGATLYNESAMATDSLKIVSLVGVYNADGTLFGELRYWLGARIGRTHCALCEITHGTFREKEEWKRQSAALPVPFEAVHLDERSPEVAAASGAQTPCVVALISGVGFELLLGPEQLEACRAEPAALAAAIRSEAESRGLHFAAQR